MLDKNLYNVLANQHIGKSGGTVYVKLLCNLGKSHIRVEKKHLFARLSKVIGEIERGGGLALVCHRAGNADNTAFAFVRKTEKHVGTKTLMRLGDGKGSVFSYERAFVGLDDGCALFL